MERPFGVTLLASFFFVQGIINIITVASYYIGGESTFTVAYYAATSVAGIGVAYGMWRGEKWGRIGTIAYSGWEILIGLLAAFAAVDIEAASPIQALTKMTVYAIVIYFMTRPEITEYFSD
jgi:hypothetical protein